MKFVLYKITHTGQIRFEMRFVDAAPDELNFPEEMRPKVLVEDSLLFALLSNIFFTGTIIHRKQ